MPTQSQPWYEQLFSNYAETYDREVFTQGTSGECDFLENELENNKRLEILDVGCGTGRHTLEMTRRGYRVTGIDLSEAQLLHARKKAAEMNLTPVFEQHDARKLPYSRRFDVAIMLCEGGFPLMETDEMNFEILRNVSLALHQKAVFIFTTLNGLFPLYHSVEKFCAASGQGATYRSNTFDLMTLRDHNITEITDDKGNKIVLNCNERYYMPSEISWMLKSLGFTTIDIYGARLGAFSRNDSLTTEDFEMLVIARR